MNCKLFWWDFSIFRFIFHRSDRASTLKCINVRTVNSTCKYFTDLIKQRICRQSQYLFAAHSAPSINSLRFINTFSQMIFKHIIRCAYENVNKLNEFSINFFAAVHFLLNFQQKRRNKQQIGQIIWRNRFDVKRALWSFFYTIGKWAALSMHFTDKGSDIAAIRAYT